MRNHLLIILALNSIFSIAVAQPAMMTKGQVDDSTEVDKTQVCQNSNNRLDVEIVSNYGDHFHHPQHPETGQLCPFSVWFTTNHQYAWYQWETTLPNWEMWNDYVFHSDVHSSGYIKVTVGDNNGNTGTDSIWFNIKDHVSPLGNFIMEIDDDLHPTFSGIATPEHYRIFIGRGFTPGQSIHHEKIFLSPGEWVYKDVNAIYNEDTLWIYNIMILDTCVLNQLYKRYLVPGLLLNTSHENEKWYLSPKTILQIDNGYYQNHGHSFVYFIYTIDEYGNKIHFQDGNGNPIILPSETTSWQIPGPHIDPYYQCGVAKVLDDGTYELLSLSNKVSNPLYYNILHIDEIEESHDYQYCVNEDNFLGTILYGKADCQEQTWVWEGEGGSGNHTGDSVVIPFNQESQFLDVHYNGCGEELSFHVTLYVNPFPEPLVWKHQGETINLEDIGAIEQPGIYSVSYGANACSDIYTVEVRDNVEIACVTVDLTTSKNKVIWQTTPEQAEYITSVKVCTEDGSTYSAPYQSGYFLFGQENEPINYHIKAVQKDGQECPLSSYTKGTIHATYGQDADGYLNIQWNLPYLEPGTNDELTGFQICQYDAASETVTVVDEVAATSTDYTGDASLFSGAQVVVAAVFNNSSIDNRSFSNLYTMLAVNENTEGGFQIYPNPTQGQFTVEGKGMMRIADVLGQEIMAKAIDGKETVELPKGMYFVKLGGMARKIVVE